MTARFKHHIDSDVSSLSNDNSSRGILYQCRMQYLKSREGDNRCETRRKGSVDVWGIEQQEEPQFSCLDERMHGPWYVLGMPCSVCLYKYLSRSSFVSSSEILFPPDELMTRSKAFRFAYWKHHREQTMRSVKKFEFGQDERNGRLSKKRREILNKMEATARARKESELRRRAERVSLNHSLESIDDDSMEESDSESIDTEGYKSADKRGYNNFSQIQMSSQQDDATSNRRKGARSSIRGAPRTKRLEDLNDKVALPPIRRKSIICRRSDDSRGEDNKDDDSAFSFLSDWELKGAQKVRW